MPKKELKRKKRRESDGAWLNAQSREKRSPLDARMVLRLLSRLHVLERRVVARSYGNGVWQQYTGRDFIAHLGRAAQGWAEEIRKGTFAGNSGRSVGDPPDPGGGRVGCVMCVATASYSSWITSYAALLEGLDVFFVPPHLSDDELRMTMATFGVNAVVCDSDLLMEKFRGLGRPVFHTLQDVWVTNDPSRIPEVLSTYAQLEERRRAGQRLDPLDPRLSDGLKPLGDLLFVSIGNDGYHKKVRLSFNAFMVAAQNLLLHVEVPAAIQWRTVELVSLAHPAVHTFRLAVLLKNGVLGFRNVHADWGSHLNILRPTCLFVSPPELQMVSNHVTETRRMPLFRSRVSLSEGLSKARDYLQGERSFRLPPFAHEVVSRGLRSASRQIVGDEFFAKAMGEMKFVLHGLAAAQKSGVRVLERLGVPVIETYGKTEACGLLSANTYAAPHLNLVGSPLPHVSFRLGAESVLEYQISSEYFPQAGCWLSTGDSAQMTPYGFAITGRKGHDLTTKGGAVLSPVSLEPLFLESEWIDQVCIVGDNLPFLSALIVLSPEGRAAYSRCRKEIQSAIQGVVDQVNEKLPRDGTIKAFEVLEEPFLESRGEVLPNGLINRLRVFDTRSAVISQIYHISP